ncbi:MAG: heparinase II/III family protein [Paludibacteraceae bacterium]
MKRISFLILLFFFVHSFLFSVDRDLLVKIISVDNLSAVLVPNQKWVPYPHYSDRVGWDKLTGENKTTLIQRGEKQLTYEWKIVKATDYFEYERSGNRGVMQGPNSQNINALSDLLMAELAEGKGRFIDQIINGVFYQCERTSWVLSAHLPLQLSGRSLPDHTDPVIDLGSGDFGSMLAWTYYFFHSEFDKVNPIISKRLRDELYNKIILPYRNEERFWWMGFKPRADGLVNNWNPWVNCNVLQCIALMEDNQEQYARDVYKTMRSVDKFINYVKNDGACEEGPSYWGHAAGKLYDYLEVLSWISNKKISLFDNKMIRNMGEYIVRSYVGNDWVVNFADASAKFSSDAGLIYRYGKAIKSDDMQYFASYLIKQQNKKTSAANSDLSDILRKFESLRYFNELITTPSSFVVAASTIYPETQFYYFKNKNNMFVAIKGGYNAESHNHNDTGTSSLWLNQMPIFIDAGVGTYTRQTFGAGRYAIWTMRSNYHNLPTINGQEQKYGQEYKATNIRVDEKKQYISLDIAKAYPDSAQVTNWVRSYRLSEDGLTINDKFRLKNALKTNEIHFLLWGTLKNSAGKLGIDVNGRKLELLYDKDGFSTKIDTITLSDAKLSRIWGNDVYRFTLVSKSKSTMGNFKYVIKQVK